MTYPDTDKIHPHGYLPDYEFIASDLGPAASVCEAGVLNGASLELWQRLFPDSPVIIGVDRDENAAWPPGTVRIVAAQDDPRLSEMVQEHAPDGLDLVVDDASHRGAPSAATFASLWPLVRPGGFYVVEDFADHWVFPSWPQPESDPLIDWVPSLVHVLGDGAETVTYTRLGLVIIRRRP